MKRGFLNKPNVAKGGPFLLKPSPASSLRTASPSSPTDVESLAQQNLLRVQRDSEVADPLSSQKIQDILRGSLASQPEADIDLQKMQNEIFDSEGVTKLEYGKVGTAAIPEDYKPANTPIFFQDGNKIDHAANTMVITSIPFKNPTGPLDPDGHSEWMVHGPTKAKVINTPGYPKPVPKPKASYGTEPAYVITPTPDMGLGVFATRDIKMGELIFAERPLLVSPRSNLGFAMPPEMRPEMQHYNLKTQMAIAIMEWEKMLEYAVAKMEPEDRNAFMDLANCHKDYGSGPILGIIRTNGFSVGSDVFDGPEMRADGSNAYNGVIKTGSRINHSCMPNVGIEFSVPSFSFQCSASIDIKAGEQLFYSYCAVEQTVAERQVELAPYGIVCSCPACTHATPETDKLRTEFQKIAMDYILNGEMGTFRRRVAESVIEPVIHFKDALIREGLHFTGEYKDMIFVIQNFYEGIGMVEKARPYKEEYKMYSEMVNGVMVAKIPYY